MDDHTKWSKPGRERQKSYNSTYMWNLKYNTNELIYDTKTDPQTENKPVVANGEREWGRDGLGVWD